jgi:hypothetical protein
MCLQRLWSIWLLPVAAVVVIQQVEVEVRVEFFRDLLELHRGFRTL